MTREEQFAVLYDAQRLVDVVNSVSSTPIRELTPSDIGEPAARARGLAQRIAAFRNYLNREPYLKGDRGVVAIMASFDAWSLCAVDDGELWVLDPVDYQKSREKVEALAVTRGMKLVTLEGSEVAQ